MIAWHSILRPTILIQLFSFSTKIFSQEIKFNRLTPDDDLFSVNVRTILRDALKESIDVRSIKSEGTTIIIQLNAVS